jgi:hypothetical protein
MQWVIEPGRFDLTVHAGGTTSTAPVTVTG